VSRRVPWRAADIMAGLGLRAFAPQLLRISP
jgi:hypothetical protein